MAFEPFLAPFDTFLKGGCLPLTLFEPFLDLFGAKHWSNWPEIGPKIAHFGGVFGPFLGRSGVILGSLRITLASFWHRFEVVLVSF